MHHVDAQLPPGQAGRVSLRADFDAVAVHDDVPALDRHLTGEAAVHRIVAEQVGVGLRVAEIVERDHPDLAGAAALVQGAQDVAADASETVDGNLDGHGTSSFLASAGDCATGAEPSPPRMCASAASTSLATLRAVNPKCSKRSA